MSNPFAHASLYVDPDSEVAKWCRANPTHPAQPRVVSIANTPQAFWLGGWTLDVQRLVNGITANAAGALVVFVIYGVRTWSTDLPGYRAFINAIAAGIGGPAIFVIEPDCLAQSNAHDEHLQYAIATLALVGTTYLDMGHSFWNPIDVMVARYRALGAVANRGFSLNVSNFRSDAELQGYADELLHATGKPSITDTSRNGNGPDPDNEFCNPRGRALGRKPLQISNASIDANLWIKRPGESDGMCNGGIAEGKFWLDYAIGLVTN